MVHRRGFQSAVVLLSFPALVCLVDVKTGAWLSLPFMLAAFGMVDATRIFLTRRSPKVEADAIDMDERSTMIIKASGGSASTVHTQRLLYAYQGDLLQSTLVWSRYPPSQVVMRVNPRQPSEVFCVERLGWSWVACLVAVVFLAAFGCIALLARRLRPCDRADSFGARVGGLASKAGGRRRAGVRGAPDVCSHPV